MLNKEKQKMRCFQHKAFVVVSMLLARHLPQIMQAEAAFVPTRRSSSHGQRRRVTRSLFQHHVHQSFHSKKLYICPLSSKTSSDDPDCKPDAHDENAMKNKSQEKNNEITAFAGVGEYDPSGKLPGERKEVNVGDPQIKVKDKEKSVTAILKELAAIQQQGPQKYCILGTRHCSYLHQQIIELLAYALVLSGNHVYTSGAGGTHAATIRGALRAGNEELLTVVIPQSLTKQPKESQELLSKVTNLVAMPQNDEMSLDIASRICNSYLLSQADQLISFAFHESSTVIEASKEAKKLDMLVTTLYLD